MADQYKVVCDLSTGAILKCSVSLNDPLTQISRSRQYSIDASASVSSGTRWTDI